MTTRITMCLFPRCWLAGEHYDDCDDDECPGCLPDRAAPGKRLCRRHTRRLAADITRAGQLWSELGLVLVSGDRPGERVSGTSIDRSLNLNERAMKARTRIWATLADWALYVATERHLTRPLDQPAALASMLHRHADWLAGDHHAALAAEQMDELAHGQPRRIAYPTGARVFEVAPCPHAGENDEPCPGIIKAVLRQTDTLLPSELICDVDDTHRWDATTWVRLGRHLHEASTAEGPTS